jgi:perosamine synthetase
VLPRFSPNYGWDEIRQTLSPASRDACLQLERQFMAYSGHPEAIALRYGRSGLYYLLKAMGIQNKKVIMPSYTCMVVANAVSASGNQPVFLDNAPQALQPDPASYVSAIDADTGMVIPTHLFGLPQETAWLYREIKDKYPHVFVLQDCAHSYFCQDSENQPVTLHGDGAIFGMNISKLVNTVHGGMLTLRDSVLAERVRQLHTAEGEQSRSSLAARLYVITAAFAFTGPLYGLVHFLTTRTSLLDAETRYYDAERITLPGDYKGRMSPFEAAIGLISLQKYAARVSQRQRIAKTYSQLLQGYAPEVIAPPWTAGTTWSHYPVLVPAHLRDEFKRRIERKFKVEIGLIVDYSVADMPAYQSLGYSPCPNAKQTVERILNLPLTYQEGLWPVHHWQSVAEAICQELVSSLRYQ